MLYATGSISPKYLSADVASDHVGNVGNASAQGQISGDAKVPVVTDKNYLRHSRF